MAFITNKSPAFIAIFCALAAAVAFTLNDSGIKFLSGDYPLHQVVLVRSVVALIATCAILIPLEGGFGNLKTAFIKLHLLRGLLVVTANMTFFLGIAAMPLGEVSAIFYVAPLLITAFSVFFLGESVSFRRWIAVIVGLIGAIIMLRPGTSSFQLAALLPLTAAVCYAGLHTLTRKIGVKDKASTMAFYIQLTFIVVCSVVGLGLGDGKFAGSEDPSLAFLFRPWIWPSARDWGIMVALGFFSAAGGYLISQAYRLGEAALIAPFEYLALAMAIMWGVVIFGEWPDAVAWTGILLILGAGLFIIWRETQLRKQREAQLAQQETPYNRDEIRPTQRHR